MCGSMVDIHSAAAEIRRGKKRKKKQDKNIMHASATRAAIKHLSLNKHALRTFLVDVRKSVIYVRLFATHGRKTDRGT